MIVGRLSHRELVAAFEPLSCVPGDDDTARTNKAQFTLAMTAIIVAGVVWGVLYLSFGETTAAMIPLAYSVLSAINLVVLRRTRRFRFYQTTELALIVALPFLLQLVLGGFVGGSAVVLWAILGPLFAVMFAGERDAIAWFGVFLATVVIAGIAQPSLDAHNGLPHWLVNVFFVLNVSAVSLIAFLMLVSFMRGRERLRRLERDYLDQTIMLRQREKLATLGTLAAGVAHELNNPAAAVRRAAEQLGPTVRGLRTSGLALSASALHGGQGDALASLTEGARGAAPASAPLSPVQQSALEQDMEAWLEDHGVAEPWEAAATLVSIGYRPADLEVLARFFDGGTLCAAVGFLTEGHAATALTDTIAEGARRISEIVAALRSYSYLDRGTVQFVDVTEGLESTLVLLKAKLPDMKIERRYSPGLPAVPVRGNELNQVWTNIIDNAIDATGGTGTILLKTAATDGGVAVEIEDDGPGMPSEVADRVFDPFFTTKPPGQGTGLGLNISFNIVVTQHGGQITVESAPGRTVFRVVLPLVAKGGTAPAAGGVGEA